MLFLCVHIYKNIHINHSHPLLCGQSRTQICHAGAWVPTSFSRRGAFKIQVLYIFTWQLQLWIPVSLIFHTDVHLNLFNSPSAFPLSSPSLKRPKASPVCVALHPPAPTGEVPILNSSPGHGYQSSSVQKMLQQ